MKRRYILKGFFLFFSLHLFAQGTWTQKADMPGTARTSAVAFSIGGKGYMGTGTTGGSTYFNDFWEWDQASNTWSQKANLPAVGRNCAVGFSIGNKGYIGTGHNGAAINDFWEWDQSSNTWAQKANCGGGARYGSIGFSIGNKGYITGGNGSTKDLWEYDQAGDSWTQRTNPSTARYTGVGFSIGSKGYVGTGSGSNDFWEWDQSSNIWTQKANFGGASRSEASGFALGNYGYIGLGAAGGNASDFWQYDVANNTWSSISTFAGAARDMASGFSIGCLGYITAGWVNDNSSNCKKDLWEYTPANGGGGVLTVNASNTSICPGNTVTISASGGVNYSWSTGATTASIVVSPGATTTYSVMATGGCVGMATASVTVNVGGSINPVVSGNVSICSGKSATLTASGGPTFSWNTGQSTSSIIVSPTVNTSYFVTVSNGACASTLPVAVAVSTPVSIAVTGAPAVCSGNSITLNGSPVIGGHTYSWSPAGSLNNSTIANPVATPTATTTYTLTVTDPGFSCTYTDTLTVAVGIPFSLTSSADTTICQSSGVQISASPSVAGAYSYSWAPTSSVSNPSISNPVAAPVVTTTFVVTAERNGCTASEAVIIQVPNLYNFFVSPSADSVCVGQSVQLSSTLQNACGVTSYSCASTNTVQIGTAGTISSSDTVTTFAGAHNSSRLQYLYRVSELNAAGMSGTSAISQFGVNISAINGSNVYQNFTVKMGCTSQNDLTTSYLGGLSTVYTAKPLVISGGINYIPLDYRYNWDGVSNLVVEICFDNSVISANSSVYYSATSFKSVLYFAANASVCGVPTGINVKSRPNSYFKYCAAQPPGSLLYTWSPAGTLSNSTIANPVATPTSATNYVLIAKDLASGCIFADSSVIAASPVFSLTSTNGISNCTTNGVKISVSPSPAGNYSYAWSPATSLSNPFVSDPMASPAVTTTYTATVSSVAGCSMSDTVKVSVNVPKLLGLNVSPPLDTLCSGNSVTLSATINKGCGTNASVCSGPVSTAQVGLAATFSSVTGTTPFAGASSSARCQYLYRASELMAAGINLPRTITQIGFNIQSIQGSNSYQNFTIKMGCVSTNSLTTTFESGLAVVYSAKPTAFFNGMNYFTFDSPYDWDGVSNLAVEICFNNPVSSLNSSVYYSNSIFSSVLSASGASVCGTATGTTGINRPNTYFKYCSASGGSGIEYLWTPSAHLNYDTISDPIATPTANISYTLTATDTSSGCVLTDVSNIFVLNSPAIPTITQNADTLTSSYAVNNQWLQQGLPISGATSQTFVITSPGYYSVMHTDANGCTSVSDTVQYMVTNIQNYVQGAEAFSIYPNPGSGLFSLELTAVYKSDVRVTVSNMLGEVLYKEEMYNASGKVVRKMDLRHLPNGCFLLSVSSNGTSAWQKIIINR